MDNHSDQADSSLEWEALAVVVHRPRIEKGMTDRYWPSCSCGWDEIAVPTEAEALAVIARHRTESMIDVPPPLNGRQADG